MEIEVSGPTSLKVLFETGTKEYCISTLEIANSYKYLLLLWLLHCLLDDSFICSGLIEHESRNIVIASKTKQAIRNVIAEALKNLNFLWSRGIIDNHEGIEIKKVIKQFPTLLDSICLILRPAVLL